MSKDEIGSLSSREDMFSWSKDELVNRICQLETHVKQLRNVICKKSDPDIKNKRKNNDDTKNGRHFDFSRFNKRHVALKIVYFGWDYHGFAVQEDEMKTIEDVLFKALLKTRLIEMRENSNYHRCGRTDKGVSAFSQVISIDLRSNMQDGVGVIQSENENKVMKMDDEEINYVKILNSVLPPEVKILAWAPVEQDFSARFDCTSRTYKYYFPRCDLDIDQMRIGCELLLGEHDFRNLCKMDVANGVTNFTRNIRVGEVNLVKKGVTSGYDIFELIIIGQAFLWHQVRCIVAVLFLIGQLREPPSIITELLDIENNPRKPQYTMADELPLVLFDCQFENLKWQMDEESKLFVIENLQHQWTKHAIKTTMFEKMLEQFEDKESFHQIDPLTPKVKSKTYKPIFQRPKCDSLQERLDHYSKKNKIKKKNC